MLLLFQKLGNEHLIWYRIVRMDPSLVDTRKPVILARGRGHERYTQEFKREAVQQVSEQGHSQRSLRQALGYRVTVCVSGASAGSFLSLGEELRSIDRRRSPG
jgi:hypothetical protein